MKRVGKRLALAALIAATAAGGWLAGRQNAFAGTKQPPAAMRSADPMPAASAAIKPIRSTQGSPQAAAPNVKAVAPSVPPIKLAAAPIMPPVPTPSASPAAPVQTKAPAVERKPRMSLSMPKKQVKASARPAAPKAKPRPKVRYKFSENMRLFCERAGKATRECRNFNRQARRTRR
jgi:hypothetical protein